MEDFIGRHGAVTVAKEWTCRTWNNIPHTTRIIVVKIVLSLDPCRRRQLYLILLLLWSMVLFVIVVVCCLVPPSRIYIVDFWINVDRVCIFLSTLSASNKLLFFVLFFLFCFLLSLSLSQTNKGRKTSLVFDLLMQCITCLFICMRRWNSCYLLAPNWKIDEMLMMRDERWEEQNAQNGRKNLFTQNRCQHFNFEKASSIAHKITSVSISRYI